MKVTQIVILVSLFGSLNAFAATTPTTNCAANDNKHTVTQASRSNIIQKVDSVLPAAKTAAKSQAPANSSR